MHAAAYVSLRQYPFSCYTLHRAKALGFSQAMLDLSITGMCKGVPVCPIISNGTINRRFSTILKFYVIFLM